MTYKGWYAIKPKQPNQTISLSLSLSLSLSIYHYLPTCLSLTVCGSIFSVIENKIADLNYNPGWGCWCFPWCQYPWEKYESICSFSCYEWIVEQTGFFSLGMATKQRKLWIQTSTYITSSPWFRGWINTHTHTHTHIHIYIYIYS